MSYLNVPDAISSIRRGDGVGPRQAIAVLGGAGHYTEHQLLAGFRVGAAIAKHGRNVITGATLGVPYAAGIGARLCGALVVGISPAASEEEHIRRYRRPVDHVDVLIYTGMGLEGRQPINVRSAQAAIFIGGEFGTLAEFSAAWTIGSNVLGVLEGVGGISSGLRAIISQVQTSYGSVICFDSDPDALVAQVCQELDRRPLASAKLPELNDASAIVKSMIEGFLRQAESAPEVDSEP
jgi:uncharacterized protein (TIGR00725 family)